MTFDTKGRRPIEYRDRDILSAIGQECQLCIGLKKKTHTSMCHVHAFIQTLKTVDIFWRTFQRDQSFWSCFRCTCIVLIFWLAKISFCNSQSRSSLINLILTEVTWTVHITFEMHTKQILEWVNIININNAQNYYSNLPLNFVMFSTNIHLISF